MIFEKDIENYLVKKVKKQGGIAYKFSSPAWRSVPDRIVLFPDRCIFFVECKAKGKKLTVAQEKEHKRIKALGFRVYTVDSKKSVEDLININAVFTS